MAETIASSSGIPLTQHSSHQFRRDDRLPVDVQLRVRIEGAPASDSGQQHDLLNGQGQQLSALAQVVFVAQPVALDRLGARQAQQPWSWGWQPGGNGLCPGLELLGLLTVLPVSEHVAGQQRIQGVLIPLELGSGPLDVLVSVMCPEDCPGDVRACQDIEGLISDLPFDGVSQPRQLEAMPALIAPLAVHAGLTVQLPATVRATTEQEPGQQIPPDPILRCRVAVQQHLECDPGLPVEDGLPGCWIGIPPVITEANHASTRERALEGTVIPGASGPGDRPLVLDLALLIRGRDAPAPPVLDQAAQALPSDEPGGCFLDELHL